MIEAGRVRVRGNPAPKPSTLVAPEDPLSVEGPPAPYVSRAGTKLEAAIDAFGIPVDGRTAIDIGASTGGFTDCLLQRGAAKVVALDVGYGQLHDRLRRDPRVRILERTNARYLQASDLAELKLSKAPELVTVDVDGQSFHSEGYEAGYTTGEPIAAIVLSTSKKSGDYTQLIGPQGEVRPYQTIPVRRMATSSFFEYPSPSHRISLLCSPSSGERFTCAGESDNLTGQPTVRYLPRPG